MMTRGVLSFRQPEPLLLALARSNSISYARRRFGSLSKSGVTNVCLLLLSAANFERFVLLKARAASALRCCTFGTLDPIATGVLVCLFLEEPLGSAVLPASCGSWWA